MASSARFDELKKKFDENPRRYFAPLANEFRKTGDAEQAVMICEEFLPQQPGHMSGHIVYGQALYEAGRMPESRTVFETSLGLDPENLVPRTAALHRASSLTDRGSGRSAHYFRGTRTAADTRSCRTHGGLHSTGAGAACSRYGSVVRTAAARTRR